MELDLSGFVGRPRISLDNYLVETAVQGRRVLIAGAGGSIGSGFAFAALAGRPRTILLLDVSEHALYESYRRIAAYAKSETEVIPIVGNISDGTLLEPLLRHHRPDLIVHAAAYKHVPLMEMNPFSAMANNAVGTYRLISIAVQCGVSQIVMVSTDKAVNPTSVMGASKRIAELVLLSHATPNTRMNAIRLGNVLGSSGSVAPLFQEQFERGEALTVTHPDARRYFMTASEAVDSLFCAIRCTLSGKVLLADCQTQLRVLDLAHYIAKNHGTYRGKTPRIVFTGLRPGDKLEEEFVSNDEMIEPDRAAGLRVVVSPCPSAAEVANGISRIECAIQRFDQEDLMRAVRDLVSGFPVSGMAELGMRHAEAM